MKNITSNARIPVRSLAGAIGIPKTTIFRMKQAKKLKVYAMPLKPKLTMIIF
jgi:hypothetical protein